MSVAYKCPECGGEVHVSCVHPPGYGDTDVAACLECDWRWSEGEGTPFPFAGEGVRELAAGIARLCRAYFGSPGRLEDTNQAAEEVEDMIRDFLARKTTAKREEHKMKTAARETLDRVLEVARHEQIAALKTAAETMNTGADHTSPVVRDLHSRAKALREILELAGEDGYGPYATMTTNEFLVCNPEVEHCILVAAPDRVTAEVLARYSEDWQDDILEVRPRPAAWTGGEVITARQLVQATRLRIDSGLTGERLRLRNEAVRREAEAATD